MQKRGDSFGSLFIYILAAVTVIVLIIFGVSAVDSMNEKACRAESSVFKQKITSAVSAQLSNYGSVSEFSIPMPCNADRIFFVDLYGNVPQKAFRNQSREMQGELDDQTGKNVFIFRRNKILASLHIDGIGTEHPFYRCFSNKDGTMRMSIKGGDNSVILNHIPERKGTLFDCTNYSLPFEYAVLPEYPEAKQILNKTSMYFPDFSEYLDSIDGALLKFNESNNTFEVDREFRNSSDGKTEVIIKIRNHEGKSSDDIIYMEQVLQDCFNSLAEENFSAIDSSPIFAHDDPLIVWHFSGLGEGESIEFGYEVGDASKDLVERCLSLIKGLAIVTDIENAPVFVTEFLPNATEDKAYSAEITAYDPDEDTDLTFSLQNAPEGMVLDQAIVSSQSLTVSGTDKTLDVVKAKISWTPDNDDAALSPVNVVVAVTDSTGKSSSKTFELHVENINDAPYFKVTPVNVRFSKGATFQLDLDGYAADNDNSYSDLSFEIKDIGLFGIVKDYDYNTDPVKIDILPSPPHTMTITSDTWEGFTKKKIIVLDESFSNSSDLNINITCYSTITKVCLGNSVYENDSCNGLSLIKQCTGQNEECRSGECVCRYGYDTQTCYNNKVYELNSCNNSIGDLIEDCVAEGGTCVEESGNVKCNILTKEKVLELKFDGNMLDSSSYNNDGSCSGAGCPDYFTVDNAVKNLGGAYSFDGSEDKITVAKDKSLNLTSSWTISAWIHPETENPGGFTGIVSTENPGGSSYQYKGIALTYDSDPSKIRCQIDNVPNQAARADAPPPFVWTMVTCTYDGSQIKLYYNNELKAFSASTPYSGLSRNDWYIAANAADDVPSKRFKGSIGDVVMWNYALSAEQINARYVDASPVNTKVLELTFDGADHFADSSDYENDAGCSGFSCPQKRTGKQGFGYWFDGTYDKLVVSKDDSLQLTGEWTIALWVKPDSTVQDGFASLISNEDQNPYNGITLGYTSSGDAIRCRIDNGAEGREATTKTPVSGEWSFVYCKYSNGRLGVGYKRSSGFGLYNNYGEINSLSYDGSSNNDWYIGSNAQDPGSPDKKFKGVIDHVMIWNYALSDTELNEIFNDEK